MIGSMFFEVEGVLASTASLRRASLLRAIADEGIAGVEAPGDAANSAHDSDSDTRDAVRRALRHHAIASDETAMTLIALRADRHFASLLQAGVSLAPGAREFLQLAAARCRLAIVTSLAHSTVEAVLALAELDGAFEVIIAGEDVAATKPAPDGHRKALERMGRRRPVDARSGLALESSAAGARAARAAGLRCAVVAPFRVENIVDADAMLTSLVGETPASLDAMLSVEAAG